jgi:hypothetical protein
LVVDGDSLIVMPMYRLVTENILYEQCDSVKVDYYYLGELVTNCNQLDSVNKIVIKDLQKLVLNGENRYNLEKEKNSYYIDMIELERKKRIKQGFIAGGLIILAILL